MIEPASLERTVPDTDSGRYTYRTYELKRQARLSSVFRKIRLYYIGFCVVFVAAAYPYLKYSRIIAAVLLVVAAAYGIYRYVKGWGEGRQQISALPKAFWTDLPDYLLIGALVYLTGGLSSFFFMAYAIPILAATIRYNIKAALGGVALAVALTGLNTLADTITPGVYFPMPFYYLFGLGTMGFAAWTISGLIGNELLLSKELYDSSVTDPLTGLFHFGYSRERINQEILRCRREGGSFSIIFFDMDHFKKVNDRYGHLVGDDVVRHVAGVLQSAVRGGDTLSRFGGDEFLLLLPGANLHEAELALQRLLQAFKERPYHIHGAPLQMGLSGGAAEYPGEGRSLEQLLQVADHKMYKQKR